MKISYLRVCRLLASSGFRDHDIAEFAHEVSQASPQALVETVAHLRKSMNELPDGRVFDMPVSSSNVSSSDIENKVERLLIEDAGLPRSIAIEQLTLMLKSRYPGINIPPESKKGFRPWIGRLSALVPEKELLHIATNLRNRSVHEAPSDWRLK